jgi:hypothetical protein
MNFTKEFIEILRNFSMINQQMYFVEGNKQSVVSKEKNIFASCKTDVNIESPFAIISLSKFLAILSLFENPIIDLKYPFLEISSEKDTNVCKYQVTKPEFIYFEKNPDKFDTISKDFVFELKYSDYEHITKLGKILDAAYIIFRGDGNKIYLETSNGNNRDSASVEIGNSENVFKAVLIREKLNLPKCDFSVAIHKKGAVSFSTDKLLYFYTVKKEDSSF